MWFYRGLLRLFSYVLCFCQDVMWLYACIVWVSLFSPAIGQFSVRNLLYGTKFLKKMLISEL